MRSQKPYQRPDTYRKGNPDAPGSWKHDLAPTSRSTTLASRISGTPSGSSKPSLLSRMSGGAGKELLPVGGRSGGLHGFDQPPPANINNPNAGVELLPSGNGRRPKHSGRSVDAQSRELVNAALGVGPQRFREPRVKQRELLPGPTQPQQQHVSIMGAARGATWVRVENLALGTTADDVMSAFAPLSVLSAKLTPPANANTVTVDLELEQRSDADGLIKQYHGVVADGNTLSVTIVNQGLKSRIGNGSGATRSAQSPPVPAGPRTTNAGQELLGPPSSGKLYSDTIVTSAPSSGTVTLLNGSTVTSGEASAAARRSDAWRAANPSLASRMGISAGGRRGRGQYHGQEMLVD
ncbi:hypothetical protein IAU60_004381 [Kwoniella sp. DSM 27419]